MVNRFPRRLIFPSLIFLIVICTSSCVHTNRYSAFYEPVLEPEYYDEITMLKPTEVPVIIETDDYEKEAEGYLAKNYVIIGFSSFTGKSQDDANVIALAKKVGATLVVIEHRLVSSTTSTYAIPTAQTTYYSGTISGRSTTYGATGTPITVRNFFFDHTAVFMAKASKPDKFGVILDELTPDERVEYERNTGAIIRVVIEDSVACYSNLLKGDLIIAIDDKKIHDSDQAFQQMANMDKDSKSLKLTIVRNGVEKDIILNY